MTVQRVEGSSNGNSLIRNGVTVGEKATQILVVDDLLLNRAQLSQVLAEVGYQVFEAANGQEAVEQFKQHQPDLVLMDIMMPVMDGYEAARKIKRLSDSQHVPIIFISGETSDEAVAKALDAGGDDFVAKPFNPSLLRAKIKVQLRIQTLNNSLQQNIQQLEWEIEDQKRTQQELQDISNYDALTGLPNRHFFLIYLAQTLKENASDNGKMALLMMDLSNFKRINDVYGHSSGDLILQQVTERLKRYVSKEQMVARTGGDHFVLFLEKVEQISEIEETAKQLIVDVAAPYELEGDEVIVGVDVGVTLYPDHCDNAEMMMRCAGTALEFARKQEHNRFSFFAEEMQQETEAFFEVLTGIHVALERGEFELYYQPQVDAINRNIVGCEVLLRWNHPKQGLISPDRFIPLLEKEGLIRPVGEWIMKEAIRQHLEWLEKGLPGVRIAVNFSAVQLQEEGLAEQVIEVIRESGIAPPWFKLEITETSTIDNLAQVAETLHAIRASGISIAVDDFGTGYSTLNYLQKLPVDIIKIDQQFIRDIPFSPEDKTLVKAVIAMAHSMGLDVVAEGVETEEQAEFLRKHSCEELQGYLFSRPLPAKEFEAVLMKMIDRINEPLTLF